MRIIESDVLAGQDAFLEKLKSLMANGLKDCIVSDEVLSSHWWLIELYPGHCVLYVGTEESFARWLSDQQVSLPSLADLAVQ